MYDKGPKAPKESNPNPTTGNSTRPSASAKVPETSTPETGNFDLIGTRPSGKSINAFHTNSDLDSGDLAQHHTLGSKLGQAAPGLSTFNKLTNHESRLKDIESHNMGKVMYFATSSTNNQNLTNNIAALVTVGWAGTTALPIFSAYSAGLWTVANDCILLLQVELTFDVNAAGERIVEFRKNGVGLRPRGNTLGGNRVVTLTLFDTFAKNDTIGIWAQQSSGATLALTAAARPFMFKAFRLF